MRLWTRRATHDARLSSPRRPTVSLRDPRCATGSFFSPATRHPGQYRGRRLLFNLQEDWGAEPHQSKFGRVGVVMHVTGERGGFRRDEGGLQSRVDAMLLFMLSSYRCCLAALLPCLPVQACVVVWKAASSLGVAVTDLESRETCIGFP